MLQVKNKQPAFIDQILPKARWRAMQKEHREAITGIVDPYLEKKQHQHKDPVLDFLFEYYAFRPSHLKKWSPGFGVLLREAGPEDIDSFDETVFNDEGAFISLASFPDHRRQSAEWILSLLENSLEKEPSFGCFGMHEWAMVYKTDNLRHDYLSLRMPPEELAGFVESRPLVCTHFDAIRHFTDQAKPLNKFELNREKFAEAEQPGCLHTNMDLYKWAFKMFPWVGSEIIRKAFLLALDTRRIDMKASPYDLTERGLEPIKIETDTGRMEYVKRQKKIYRRSVPVREQLIGRYKLFLSRL